MGIYSQLDSQLVQVVLVQHALTSPFTAGDILVSGAPVQVPVLLQRSFQGGFFSATAWTGTASITLTEELCSNWPWGLAVVYGLPFTQVLALVANVQPPVPLVPGNIVTVAVSLLLSTSFGDT